MRQIGVNIVYVEIFVSKHAELVLIGLDSRFNHDV